MASVVMQKFSGLVPRVSPRLLSNGSATQASMVKLWSGELRPFHELSEPEEVDLPSDAPILTIYRLLEKWLAWTTDVDVATGFTALQGEGHIYWTGDGYPKQANYASIAFGPATPLPSASFKIGIDPVDPNYPPIATPGGGGTGDPIVRSYVYTFYNLMNEESVPSPPSNLVSVADGGTVTITGFAPTASIVPPASPISEIRIYRTSGGAYLYVDTIAPNATSYVDTKTDLELGEPLQSQHWFPPPPDIEGLIGLACGSLAAFHGNKVAFSEPYQPGAWPPEYERVFDYPVVALGTFGQVCVVATTGYTYLVSGSAPASFSVARVPDPYPCVSKRSMVSSDNGVVYASADGLIFVGNSSYTSYGGYSGVYVLTRDLMTYDEWQVYNPATLNGVVFDGRYYGFYVNYDFNPCVPGQGFVLDFSSRLRGLVTGAGDDGGELDKQDILVNLDFYASATFANPQVPLHVVIDVNPHFDPITGIPLCPGLSDLDPDEDEDTEFTGPFWNELFLWEGSTSNVYHPLTWESKQFSFPYAVTFSAAKLIFNQAFPIDPAFTFSVIDGATDAVLYTRRVTTANPFRLPSLGPRTEWRFKVEGRSAVQMIEVASSYADLQERKAM